MGLERFLNQQNIERYSKLLDIVSDEIQRRQIKNLLAEEEDKANELRQGQPRPLSSKMSTAC